MTGLSDETTQRPLAHSAIEDAMAALSLRVAHLREQSKMTQDQLAERAGLTQTNLSKLEHGGQHPRIDTLLRLQHAFKLRSIEELFGELPPADAPTGSLIGV
jgi:transcriptional regulator with XRE-family HTH domain